MHFFLSLFLLQAACLVSSLRKPPQLQVPEIPSSVPRNLILETLAVVHQGVFCFMWMSNGSQNYQLKRQSFPHWFGPLSKLMTIQVKVLCPALWSTCLSFCRWNCLRVCGFMVRFEPGNVRTPALFFFTTLLTTLCILPFHIYIYSIYILKSTC